MNELVLANQEVTMTSIEIAEVVKSRHDNVKRTIERLVSKGIIDQPPMEDGEKSGNNLVVKHYLVSKRSSYIVVAQLSPEFTADLVDRWQELEGLVKQPEPMTRLEILTMAIESEKKVLAIAAERDEAVRTKALISDKKTATAMATASAAVRKSKKLTKDVVTLSECRDCFTVKDIVKGYPVTAVKANKILEAHGYLYTEEVKGKNRKRLTKKGETVGKEFVKPKYIQVGYFESSVEDIRKLILGK